MLIIEEPRRNRPRSVRTVIAVLAASAIVAAGAALWEYGRRLGAAAPEVSFIVLVTIGIQLAGERWLRTRHRRADLRWRAALVLRDGVHPGLQGRWSRAALVFDAVGTTGFAWGGLFFFGGQVGAGSQWSGPIGSILAGVATIVLAATAFGRLRRSGYVTITSRGVTVGDDTVGWERIEAVYRDSKGAHLRGKTPEDPRYVRIGGPDCAVSDERLAEVIEFYLAHPHRRSALDDGPGQVVLPARREPTPAPSKTA
ncbi:hypothetical protein OG792_26920 [Micromonospora sp. NBC_01699]|uniref:hypothetical protein n=1 Tax=Micromonospora sp. NBC_01699 TaxID=2975984 RepID=UPI002E2E55A5|nr:hypothetical protein [Micromonospora sp. NBC_01699]